MKNKDRYILYINNTSNVDVENVDLLSQDNHNLLTIQDHHSFFDDRKKRIKVGMIYLFGQTTEQGNVPLTLKTKIGKKLIEEELKHLVDLSRNNGIRIYKKNFTINKHTQLLINKINKGQQLILHIISINI
jgi:hypothetical protein